VVKQLDVGGTVKKIKMEKKLKKISKQLKGASKLHAGQAKKIDNMIKKSPNKFIRTGRTKDTGVVGKATEKVIHHGFKKMYDQYKGAKKIYNYLKSAPKGSASTGFAGLKKKKSPALAKLSASCKAAAKRKFKVYPSAYANMWAAKTQRQGKC